MNTAFRDNLGGKRSHAEHSTVITIMSLHYINGDIQRQNVIPTIKW